MHVTHSRRSRSSAMMCAVVFVLGCGGPAPLTVDMPLHLEDHLDAATIVGSEVPDDIPEPVEWLFDEPQPDWRPADPVSPQQQAIRPIRIDDALRLPLTGANRNPTNPLHVGAIYVELPDWSLQDWGYVEIRARTRDRMRYVGLAFNFTEEDHASGVLPFYSSGDRTPLVTDGTVQTYRLSLDPGGMRRWEGPWTHMGIYFTSRPEATLDILSIRVSPRETEFAGDRAGVRMVRRGTKSDSRQEAPHARSLFLHTAGKIAYRVRVPENGRLDVGLGVLGEDAPVTFAITTTLQDGAVETLLEETYADHEHWGQRSVDLSHLAGRTVTLALEAEAARAGTVALWAAPTLSGARSTDRPNVIFYVIDGGGAELTPEQLETLRALGYIQ